MCIRDRSERDPTVPVMLAELLTEAGLPNGILNVVNGDKEAVDSILDHDDIGGVGFVGSTAIAEYVYTRGCANGNGFSALEAQKTIW